MSNRLLWVPLMASALVLGCSEPLSETPTPEPPAVPDAGLHFLAWDTADGPVQFTATGGTPYGDLDLHTRDGLYAAPGDSILLDNYAVSFWAVRGEQRFIQINYVNATGIEGPYIRFDISDPVQRPDGSSIAVGDSVLITVTADPTDIVVYLEPSGLQFGAASDLQIWYGGANDDLNNDGSVNDDDAYIQESLLGVWYQEGVANPWENIVAEHNPQLEWFHAWLEHFSGYAISW